MHDEVVERSALCSIMKKPGEGYKALSLHNIDEGSFVVGFHQVVFEAIVLMLSTGERFSKQSVWARVTSIDGGFEFNDLDLLFSLNEDRPHHWCDLLRKYQMARVFNAVTDDAKKRFRNIFAADDVIAGVTEDLFHMIQSNKIEEQMEDNIEELLSAGGYPSKYACVNEVIVNYPKCVPVVVGARPGIGKTTWMLNECLGHIMRRKGDWFEYVADRHGTIFSLEMPRKDLIRKSVCILSGLDERKVKSGLLTPQEREIFKAYWDLVRRAPLMIYDRGHTPRQVCSNMRYSSEKNGTTFIGLDYAQRLRAYAGTTKDRAFYADASNSITDTLKGLPSEPMMMILSQLSRDADINKHDPINVRKRQVPRLSHFKETGALEEDAFIAGLLYPDPTYIDKEMLKQPVVFSIEKNRGGETGPIHMIFDKPRQTFGGHSGS